MSTNKKTQPLDCEIVQDLLPLYHDKAVSEVTENAVKTHLETCQPCTNEYELLCTEFAKPKIEPNTAKKFSAMMKKIKHKRALKIALSTVILLCIIITTFYVLYSEPLIKMKSDDFAVSRAYKFEVDGEGYIFLYCYDKNFKMSSGCSMSYEVDKKGNVSVDSKIPVLYKLNSVRKDIISAGNLRYEVMLYKCDLNADFNLNGKTIEVTSTDVPEYVYEYYAFENDVDDIYLSWLTEDEGKEQYTFGADYSDGTTKYWDIDGNVVEK